MRFEGLEEGGWVCGCVEATVREGVWGQVEDGHEVGLAHGRLGSQGSNVRCKRRERSQRRLRYRKLVELIFEIEKRGRWRRRGGN